MKNFFSKDFFSLEVRPPFLYALAAAFVVIFLLAITGCKGQEAPAAPAKTSQSEKAAEAANSITFTENAEIENIKKRLELTSDPGLTGFVLLMNEAGQPIMYTGVRGKLTSGSKRLTSTYTMIYNNDCGDSWCDEVVNHAPSDEGTWGNSNPYIYFWTTTGQYMQWNGKYLYSDKPFRTKVDPLVVAIE